MHLPRSYPRLSALAASGILVGGGVAAGRVVGRCLRRSPAAGEVRGPTCA
jgi:hypothetical protein